MRWDRFTLGFTDESNKRLNSVQKAIPSRFLYSDIFWGFEVSEGDRPAEPFMPHRYAPVVREITTKSYFKKGIIIPTGTIISAVPLMATESYTDVGAFGGLGAASGTVNSGEIALGIGYDTTTLLADINDGFEGYDRLRIVGQVANGGEAVTDAYTTLDTERGRVGLDGALVTTSSTFARPANIPIGFVTEDIYIFDDGNKLNYTEIGEWNKFSSFATDYFVEMPYCADAALLDDGTVSALTDGYTAARALGMPYYWAPSVADLIIGNFSKPDRNGKYKAEYTAAQLTSGSYNVNKTIQTVGKLVSFTNKFPMDMEGMVETYHTTKTGGTATYGLEYRLYVFMTTVLAAAGESTDYTTLQNYLNSGKFGMARLNLHTS